MPEICCYKGLVQRNHADFAGELRSDAAASIFADALDAFVAIRSGSERGKPASKVAKVLAITLEKTGSSALRAGQLVTCWIEPSSPAASKVVTARLMGSAGVAWQATIQLSSEIPGNSPEAAVAGPDASWPPVRLMRSMRKHDCDQAGHVNVQVFLDLVDDAVGVLCLEASHDAMRLQIVQARILFKQELFEGDVVTVHSGIRHAGPDGMDVVHGIVHQPSGTLACIVETRIAALDETGAPMARIDPLVVAPASSIGDWPSLPPARPPGVPRVQDAPLQHARTTVLSVVDAWDADQDGWLSMRAMINMCSTGARQYLATIGLNGARFLREKITVAAVDYLIDIRRRPALGCNLAVRSAYLSGSAKSIRFSHHIMDADDHTVYATVEIVGVMVDLANHRSMEIPADVRQRLDPATS